MLGFLLTHLGAEYLWSDEADTAVLGANITKFGVPKAWDGVTFTDSDLGARVNNHLVMVSHPWVQFYTTAASFIVFGKTAFAARLPFAIAGWLTLIAGYLIVLKITGERSAALATAASLAFSPQFLLYSRQCRNYSLNMLLTCGLLWSFLRMRTAGHAAVFATIAILLFHAHPIGIAPLGALALLTLIYRPFAAQRRWFWIALPAVCLFTLPWFALAERGYEENAALPGSLGEFFVRCVQYVIECISVTPVIGIGLLLVGIAIIRSRARGKPIGKRVPTFSVSERDVLICASAIIFFFVLAMAMTQPSHAMWIVGLRYTPAVIPIVAMCAGIVIARITERRAAIAVPLLLLFCITKLPLLTPWLCGNDKRTSLGEARPLEAHVPLRTRDCFLNTDELFVVEDVWKANGGTVREACAFLDTYARPGDHVVSNIDPDALYFHTLLPQNLKILRWYPVYERARRNNLPDYVFNVGEPRWVIWRPFWEGTDGYNWPEVRDDIAARGGRLTAVATLRETVWENRENIHFRRYSGNTYLFDGFQNLPDGNIIRVDWN